MNDRDWLRKIRVAFAVYKESHPDEADAIDRFIHWLYKEYGIQFEDLK